MMDDKPFLSQVRGFTPVIDILAEELGTMTALVYGIVWRYCQMEDKVCRASKETIAGHANISSKTVQRHLAELVKKGYLIDTTPDQKHRPHIYKDAGKVIIEGLIEAKLVGRTESPTSQEGGTESPTRGDTESHQGRTESPVKIESNIPSNERKKNTPADFGIGEHDPLDGVPVATDNHQRAVDKASGGNGADPNQEVAIHLFWGFERDMVDLPPEKKWKKWYQGGKRLRERLTQTGLETQVILKRIDAWFAEEGTPEAFWRDNPLHTTALDIIARYIKNGGKRATNHQSRRVPGSVPKYTVADPATFGGELANDP